MSADVETASTLQYVQVGFPDALSARVVDRLTPTASGATIRGVALPLRRPALALPASFRALVNSNANWTEANGTGESAPTTVC
jgi:hypothetical protein